MLPPSLLVKTAVLGCAAAAICSLLPPASAAVAAQRPAGLSSITQVPENAPGSLAGTVRVLGGPGLAGICVTASGPAGIVPAITSAGGRYLLSGLRPGAYRIGFDACGQPGRYATATAGPVLVGSGHPTVLGPVTLRPVSGAAFVAASARAMRAQAKADALPAAARPELTGTVTSKSGRPLAGICVSAVLLNSFGLPPFTFGVATSKKGNYKFPAGFLIRGHWKILFSTGCGNKGNFAPQWWRFAPTAKKAAILVVRKGSQFTGIDARLGVGALISGTVRAASESGSGLPGACVTVTGKGGVAGLVAFAKTGPGGKYLVNGLGTGQYAVQFQPGCGSDHGFAESKIDTVLVTDGKTANGVNGFLPKSSEFGGIVTTGAARTPVPGICVAAEGSDGINPAFGETRTGPDGRYSFTNAQPGRWEMAFFAGCGSKGSFAPQFYRAQASEYGAAPISVPAGAHVRGIDAVMQPGGVVTGIVTNAAGAKLTGVCAVLTSEADQSETDFQVVVISVSSSGGALAPAAADSGAVPFDGVGVTKDGRYRVTDLQPGSYSVSFSAGCKPNQPTEAATWFSPQGGDTRSLVTVGSGTTSGIDAKLPAPGTITGVVTGPTGKPVAGVCVFPVGRADEPSNSVAELVGGALTGQSNKHGVYRLTGLAAGKYGLEFEPCDVNNLATEWYRQAAQFAGLTPVVVRPGRVTARVDERMLTGQSISGRITMAGTRAPVARACIDATDAVGHFVGFSQSRKDGTYTVPNLALGTYDLRVGPCTGAALATVRRMRVKVGSLKPVTGIDVALPVPGGIAGQVTGGRPAQGIGAGCVIATPETGPGVQGRALARANGTYSLRGLAPGRYLVKFSSQCLDSVGGFAPQWFDGQSARSKASLVTVAAGKTTTGISAKLPADGSIEGVVKVSGAAKPGVCALAYPRNRVDTPRIGVTNASGSYTIGGLVPGQYVVEFRGGCGASSYHTQWFDGASSRARATPVLVTAGSATLEVNAH